MNANENPTFSEPAVGAANHLPPSAHPAGNAVDTPAIETRGLRYEAGPHCLIEGDIAVKAGKVTSIVGPNGSGKSTLLRMVAGLLKPAEGAVIISGRPSASYSRLELARELAMLQQSREAEPELTVRELVAFGRTPRLGRFRQRLGPDDEREIDWALRQMNIRRHEDRMIHTLSGGERQKALIAMALAQRTGILLLDEPTTYLDIAHQLELMTMLRRLNRESGMTIVMVLHDLQQAAAFSDEVIALKAGQVVARGAPQRVITADFMRDVYEVEAKVRHDGPYPLIIPLLERESETAGGLLVATDIYRVASGAGERLVDYWSQREEIAALPGFLGMELLQNERTDGCDEISVVTRWQSAEAWQSALEQAGSPLTAKLSADFAIVSHERTLRVVKVRRAPFSRPPRL